MAFLIPEMDERSAHGLVLEKFVTARTAADLTGYNIQHICRLAFDGKLEAVRAGRAWLIDYSSLMEYTNRANKRRDKRYGPRRKDTSFCGGLLEGLDL